MRLFGTPVSILSNGDARFIARVWKKFQEAMGTELKLFHPQTDGHSERTIQILKGLLRSCALDWQATWEDYLPLVVFAYNNI